MIKNYNRLSICLWLLTFAFIFRVLGQLLALQFDIPYLPAFDQWYSGALAYPALFASQCIIILIMTTVSYRVNNELMQPNRKIGVVLQVIGWIYFSTMFARWLIGITNLVDVTWFQRPIPSFFHMVLASYVLFVASYHNKSSLRDK